MRDDPAYHPGERLVQERMGVSDDAARLAGMFATGLGLRQAAFVAEQQVAVAASVSATGDVWASLLTGTPGFLHAVEPSLLAIHGHPRPDDVLSANVAERPEIGLLLIDLVTRRRLRLNGRALADGDRLFVELERVYGNCPKYIRPRVTAPGRGPGEVRRTRELTAEQRRLLARADTFFIASRHPTAGADASHRGGDAGLVTVHDARTVSFADLPGNNMFNTLGNLVAEPRAGLLVPDFGDGSTLQLRGDAEVVFEDRPRVTLRVREVVHTSGWGLTA